MNHPKRWKDLDPDERLLRALDEADAGGARSLALNSKEVPPKTQWSKRFADACARMIAREVRQRGAFSSLTVLPDESRAEPPTFVTGDKRKRVDVIASSLVSGLQVGISLKGMNFRDQANLNFDKNLTGRTYELQDEVRVIHEYQPAAFLTAVYFMPLAATLDKKDGPSSFARTVEHLRARAGRIDPTLPSQLARVDMALVALYVAGDRERYGDFVYEDLFPRGVVRYFDVSQDPPKRGRPMISSTFSLDEAVDLITDRYQGGGPAQKIRWAEPERD